MGINNWSTYRRPNETWGAARDRFFQENDAFNDWANGHLDQVAGRIKNVPQALEILYHTTQDPFTKAQASYLLERTAVEGLNWQSVLTYTAGHPAVARGPKFDPNTGVVRYTRELSESMQPDPMNRQLLQITPDKPSFDSALVHEINHARQQARLQDLRVRGDADLSERSDDYVTAMFDTLAESPRGDSANTEELRKAVASIASPMSAPLSYMDKLQNAWKSPLSVSKER
jgi:hypothetical protein